MQNEAGFVDVVTGLPDVRLLEWAYGDAADWAADMGGRVALLHVDLCDLDAVNAMFGRAQGDRVLAAIAERLRDSVSPRDVVIRNAGDEFVLLHRVLPAPNEVESVDVVALEVLSALRRPYTVGGHVLSVGANLGVALATEGEALEALLHRAGVALFRSKLAGPDQYEIYERSTHDQVSPAVIVDWMREGIDDERLRLDFQPICSLAPGRSTIVAAEALLRWNHPTLGTLLPDVVLPALEDSGLIVEVGDWVVDTACRQARAWADDPGGRWNGAPPDVFVNVSPRQVLAGEFVGVLDRSIDRHGIDANRVCLELSGLSHMPERSPVWSVLREVKALGVRLCLDNFGDDDTSYGLVRHLRLDHIKLGRTLTSERNATPQDEAIAESVVALARGLGVSAIAAGLEDPASLARARRLGCDLGQGFYFGVAGRPDELGTLPAGVG